MIPNVNNGETEILNFESFYPNAKNAILQLNWKIPELNDLPPNTTSLILQFSMKDKKGSSGTEYLLQIAPKTK
jgi:hypothetical protein